MTTSSEPTNVVSIEDAQGEVEPNAMESEKAILGHLVLWPDSVFDVIVALNEEDFYMARHRAIYKTMVELVNENGTYDVSMLKDRLKEKRRMKSSDASYVLEIAKNPSMPATLALHIQQVQEKSTIRSLLKVAQETSKRGKMAGARAEDLLAQTESKIMGLVAARNTQKFASVYEVAGDVLKNSEAAGQSAQSFGGVLCGFSAIDEISGGFYPGDFVIIAGRPSMGKTALGMSMMMNIAKSTGPVAVFSLEMPKDQLVQRMISSESRIEYHRMRKGALDRAEWGTVMDCCDSFRRAPLYIDDTPSLDPVKLKAKIRRLHNEVGLKAALVDYLQLMTDPTAGPQNRVNEVAMISRAIKSTAKEIGIPFIALCQLSRAVEKRDTRRPVLSDLRECGALEQDADFVGFLYRPAYYAVQDGKQPMASDQNRAELIVAKQRNGPTGKVNLAFVDRYARFENWAPIPL